MSNETKKYFCTRPRLYSALVTAGFLPIELVPHFTKPKYHVWVFEETPELRQLVDDYYSQLEEIK